MTIRIILVLLLLGGAAAVGVFLAPANDDPPAELAKEPPVEDLVKDLGSPSFRTREMATRKLGEVGEAALSALRKAAASGDVETRRRCEGLIRKIEAQVAEEQNRKVITKVSARWAKGGVRKLLERLVQEPKFATPAHLHEAWELAEFVAARTSQISGKKFRPPHLDISKFSITRRADPSEPSLRHKIVLVDSLARDVTAVRDCFIVSTGNVIAPDCLLNSVVLTCGNFLGSDRITDSIVVAFGDGGGAIDLRDSIVLAGGPLRGFRCAKRCFFEVREVSSCNESITNAYLNVAKVNVSPRGKSSGDRFLKGPGPLEFFVSDGRRSPPAKGQAAGKK
jgi:hypothetical protein